MENKEKQNKNYNRIKPYDRKKQFNEEVEFNKNDASEVKEEKNTNIKTKKKKIDDKDIIIILLILILFLGIACFIVYGFKDKIEEKPIDTSDIKLNYTQTSDTKIEGVYITDVSEVVENVMPSIVAITSKTLISSGMFGPNFFGYGSNKEQYSEGAGSGIIISKTDTELLILTNNHVVAGTSELTVKFINDKSVDATIKGASERKDVAVISIKLSSLDKDTIDSIKLATIGKSNELKVGNGVIAIGNALGYGQSVTTGVVSALNREVTIDNITTKMIQIDAAINGGNSGGALLNSKGEVVGINSAKYSSSSSMSSASIEGMGFAIPITDIDNLITTLMNGQEETKPVLGVEGYMTSESYYDLPQGFYISKITEGSGADKAGLEIGNIITEIEGKKIDTFSDLSDVLYERKPGDKVKLKIKYASGREYKEKEVEVTLSK